MPTSTDRPLRADARRNRDALVDAARRMLATGADDRPAAPEDDPAGRTEPGLVLDAVAREAGVGIGTLYRHFPTRDALVDAVYAAELDDLAASAPQLLADLPPDAALREWLARYARFTATKRGMADALHSGLTAETFPSSGTRARLTAAITPMLEAGARAGSLRADVDAADVTALLLGVFLTTARTNVPGQTGRLLDIVLDGLRQR